MASVLPDAVPGALDAARRVLDDLDSDQVPADLRRVAAHSGGLTPPLAAALVRGIERYVWLRERALENYPKGGDAAGRAFLERSAGWVDTVAAAAARHAEAAAARRREAEVGRAAALERDLAEAQRRLKAFQKELASERGEWAARLEAARAPGRAERGDAARAEAAAREQIGAAVRRGETAEREAAGLRAEVRRLMEVAAEERRRRASAEHSLAEAGATAGWVTGDPVGIASHLDDVALMARPPAPPAAEVPRGRRPPLRLPVGVVPDSAEAVDWVLARRGPVTVVVDGYNAGYSLAGLGDPASARRRLALEVARLPTLAAGAIRVIVVYDSTVEPDDRAASGAVTVRFASPGATADDEITELASTVSGDVVVITGDRALREAVEARGALALWSAALVAWSRRR